MDGHQTVDLILVGSIPMPRPKLYTRLINISINARKHLKKKDN